MKTELYYINKAVRFSPFNLIKAHIIDDDCNEYIATIKETYIPTHSYLAPDDLAILDLETYNSNDWDRLVNDMEFAKAEKIS